MRKPCLAPDRVCQNKEEYTFAHPTPNLRLFSEQVIYSAPPRSQVLLLPLIPYTMATELDCGEPGRMQGRKMCLNDRLQPPRTQQCPTTPRAHDSWRCSPTGPVVMSPGTSFTNPRETDFFDLLD